MPFQLGDDQHATLTLTGVDDAGNAVPMDAKQVAGVPTWVSSDDASLTALAAVDGLSADVIATGPLSNSVTITASGTSSNGVAFSLPFEFAVVATAAVGFGLSISTPAHK